MVIECNERINNEYIKRNNIKPEDTILIKNTVNQTSKDLSEIPEYIKIFVVGGFDAEKEERYNRYRHKNRNTFFAKELAAIVKRFEKYESEIDPHWSDLAKALYIFGKLRLDLTYATDEEDNDSKAFEYIDSEIRGIRGILRKKAVCAGIAQIYKEFMERQGINCKYRAKHGFHAWNEVEIDGKYYPIDLTLEVIEKTERLTLKYFMNNPNFYNEFMHKADDAEGECISRVLDKDTIQKAHLEIFDSKHPEYKDDETEPDVDDGDKE